MQRNGRLSETETGFTWSHCNEYVRVDAWGVDGVRVRATLGLPIADTLWALESDLRASATVHVASEHAELINGRIRASIDTQGTIRFTDTERNGEAILEEIASPKSREDHGRKFVYHMGDTLKASAHFHAYDGERIYGLGQHQHGLLEQKGATIMLEQTNTEVAVPFVISSRGYGFLWNNPAVGRVDLGRTRTSWHAERTKQLDYVVVVGDGPREILERYGEVTGRPPMMPEYAAGFWQSKLRYKTQEEVLSVAREHKRRGLPMSVIVIDFYHSPHRGDWRFDPEEWPDPHEMVRELSGLGIEVMVSIWPTVSSNSENFACMQESGMLLQPERGVPLLLDTDDAKTTDTVYCAYYDPGNQAARDFLWSRVKEHYYDAGIRIFWLDACEPEIRPLHFDNLRMRVGNMEEAGCAYAMLHQQAFYEGMRAAGQKEVLNLARSAWAGSQRYGAAVWSGDVDSTFKALREQIPAGLNMSLSGIPWWTTDIGGFHDGNIEDPEFQELVVRWFQFALFCPIFRLHGYREEGHGELGAANEVWSFGERAYSIITEILFVRERLKPYIMTLMRTAHEQGIPPMRPLFMECPDDAEAWEIKDQFFFGPDLLVAPVVFAGANSRRVYLPAGMRWRWAWSPPGGSEHRSWDGGQWIEVAAPLDTIPVFSRESSGIRLDGTESTE